MSCGLIVNLVSCIIYILRLAPPPPSKTNFEKAPVIYMGSSVHTSALRLFPSLFGDRGIKYVDNAESVFITDRYMYLRVPSHSAT